jgi:hypothetical protein
MRFHNPQVHAPPRRQRKKKDRQGESWKLDPLTAPARPLGRGPCAFIISRRWHHIHRFPIDLRRPNSGLLIGVNRWATFSDPITAEMKTPTGVIAGGGICAAAWQGSVRAATF